jgi:hypothetical protein
VNTPNVQPADTYAEDPRFAFRFRKATKVIAAIAALVGALGLMVLAGRVLANKRRKLVLTPDFVNNAQPTCQI